MVNNDLDDDDDDDDDLMEQIFGSDSSAESESDDDETSEESATELLSEESDSTDTDTEKDCTKGQLLVAQAPTVLEPSVPIFSDSNPASTVQVSGFRICGDNIDKTIRRRYVRSDKSNISIHYFHSYAVKNRINFSDLSDLPPNNSGLTSTDDLITVAHSMQPTEMDDEILRSDISVLISRILCKKMKFFETCFSDVVKWHIPHKYSSEMSQKSVVVGIKSTQSCRCH